MWRSFFLAMGVTLCILGVECLGITEVVLKSRNASSGGDANATPAASRRIVPAEYAPWSLMGLGAVVILYAYDLPRRLAG